MLTEEESYADGYAKGYHDAILSVGKAKIMLKGPDFTIEYEPEGALEHSYVDEEVSHGEV